MFGSQLIVIALATLTVASTIDCFDYGQDVESSGSGGLAGALTGKNSPMAGLGSFFGFKKQGAANSLAESGKSEKLDQTQGEEAEEGFLGTDDPSELIKLLLNPFELCAQIAEHFKLAIEKFFPLVIKSMNSGLELAVHPVVLSLKIIEKIFVADQCKLNFVCKLANHLSFSKDIMPTTISDRVLNESKVFKALCDGIYGRHCESIYPCDGEPQLKEEYKSQGEEKHQYDEASTTATTMRTIMGVTVSQSLRPATF